MATRKNPGPGGLHRFRGSGVQTFLCRCTKSDLASCAAGICLYRCSGNHQEPARFLTELNHCHARKPFLHFYSEKSSEFLESYCESVDHRRPPWMAEGRATKE